MTEQLVTSEFIPKDLKLGWQQGEPINYYDDDDIDDNDNNDYDNDNNDDDDFWFVCFQ